MSNQFTVTLGEQEYTIRQLPARKASGWRNSLKEPLLKIVGIVAQFSQAGDSLKTIEEADIANLAPLLQTIIEDVHDGLDQLPDVVLSYSPELQADQQRIDDTTTDEEFLAAFIQMAQHSYPFFMLIREAKKVGYLAKQFS